MGAKDRLTSPPSTSQLSRKYKILDVSQHYGPPRRVTEIVLHDLLLVPEHSIPVFALQLKPSLSCDLQYPPDTTRFAAEATGISCCNESYYKGDSISMRRAATFTRYKASRISESNGQTEWIGEKLNTLGFFKVYSHRVTCKYQTYNAYVTTNMYIQLH
jgi:hypothetical protein